MTKQLKGEGFTLASSVWERQDIVMAHSCGTRSVKLLGHVLGMKERQITDWGRKWSLAVTLEPSSQHPTSFSKAPPPSPSLLFWVGLSRGTASRISVYVVKGTCRIGLRE